MKQIILVTAAAVMVASCNQGSGDAAMYKKQVDSLTKELAARPAKPTMTTITPPPSAGAGNIPNPIDTNGTNGLISNAMMDTATANGIIQNWHKYVRTSLKDDTDRLAFMIDANILRNYIL